MKTKKVFLRMLHVNCYRVCDQRVNEAQPVLQGFKGKLELDFQDQK